MEHHWRIGSAVLGLRQGDLTQADVDGIVNAANSGLMGGGGVDGAIHAAAGPELLAACRVIVQRQGPLPPGQAVITPGFKLRARHVIHTVGPIWHGGGRGEAQTLAAAYRSSLELAQAHGLTSLAFPAISCGAYGYPVDQAARVALTALREGLMAEAAEGGGSVEAAHVYLFSRAAWEPWAAAAAAVLGPADVEA